MTDILVASMWKPFYQRRARAFARRVSGRFSVKHLSAELTDKAGLIEALSSAPPLVLYFGHGHSEGWTGFRGIKKQDIPFVFRTTVVSFSCSALDKTACSEPFGVSLVRERRVKAFVGTKEAMDVSGLAQIAVIFSEAVASSANASIDTLMASVASKVAIKNNGRLSTAWAGMAAIGDTASDLFPRQQLVEAGALGTAVN